jgi:uncharacterized protein
VTVFEWDDAKNLSNLRKHGISFEDATAVFDDPFSFAFSVSYDDGEERWSTIGVGLGLLVMLVVHTYRDTQDTEVVRIISARRATRPERRRYEQEIG